MQTVRVYRDLEAWQFAMTLVERCDELSRDFPREELFGLTVVSQARSVGRLLYGLHRALDARENR